MKKFSRPIGGERLGSGKRIMVDMKTYNRSSFDLGYIWRSTMAAGTLVPFLCKPMLPGDTFDIDISNFNVITPPTVGPLFGSYKVQLDVFQVPMRLYMSALHNNKMGVGNNMRQVKLPKIAKYPLQKSVMMEQSDPNNAEINPSCILHYLGIKGSGLKDSTSTFSRKFNAIPLFAYHDIYKNYYANKQEEIGFVIDRPSTTQGVSEVLFDGSPVTTSAGGPFEVGDGSFIQIEFTTPYVEGDEFGVELQFTQGAGTWHSVGDIFTEIFKQNDTTILCEFPKPLYHNQEFDRYRLNFTERSNSVPVLNSFQLSNIDTLREQILATPPFNEYVIEGWEDNNDIYPVGSSLRGAANNYATVSSRFKQQGLLLKTYQNDIFNNWLNKEWLDDVTTGINSITAVDVSDGRLLIDSLVLSKKIYNMLNRVALSGGSYKDWIEATYTENFFMSAESPIYVGGASQELVFQEVVSNAAAELEGQKQPLGTLGGRGVMGGRHKGGKVIVKAQEFSYVMGIISITPRIDYSQGNAWDVMLDNMDQWHKPELDQIGFQDIVQERQAWWSTTIQSAFNINRLITGKQPAWIEYMTAVNETHGNFAEPELMWMTLNRRYELPPTAGNNKAISDNTSYVDPSKFNHVFADSSLDAQNFWVQIKCDITARRKISSKVMPNL